MTEASKAIPNPLLMDPNMRACLIVVQGINRYPQADASKIITADVLMRGYLPGKNPFEGKTVTIGQMASINPDGEYWAADITRRHHQFGILRTVTPQEAISFISFFAIQALEAIRYRTVRAANRGVLPALTQFVELPHSTAMGTTPAHINRHVTSALEDFLNETPDVAREVAENLREEASLIRTKGPKQQLIIQKLYHQGIQGDYFS